MRLCKIVSDGKAQNTRILDPDGNDITQALQITAIRWEASGEKGYADVTLQLTGIPLEVAAQFPAKWIEERIAALTALQRLGGGEEPLDVHSGPVVYTGAPFPLPECQYTGPTEPTDGQMKADYEKRYGFRVRADGEQLMAVQVTGGTVESVVELTPDGEDL